MSKEPDTIQDRRRADGDVDTIRGRRRTYYSTRILALAAAVAATVAGLCGVGLALVLAADASDKAYRQDLASCHRQNQAARESNDRQPALAQDARNLERLARELAKTRDAEARAFERIGRAFEIQAEVAELVTLLEEAAKADKAIAGDQARLSYGRLPVLDCFNPNVVRHP